MSYGKYKNKEFVATGSNGKELTFWNLKDKDFYNKIQFKGPITNISLDYD